jgi:hypothetical protein
VYGRKVFGDARAVVSVGLDYDDCGQTVWLKRAAEIPARNPHLRDFGGWTLDLHHRLEPRCQI